MQTIVRENYEIEFSGVFFLGKTPVAGIQNQRLKHHHITYSLMQATSLCTAVYQGFTSVQFWIKLVFRILCISIV